MGIMFKTALDTTSAIKSLPKLSMRYEDPPIDDKFLKMEKENMRRKEEKEEKEENLRVKVEMC